MRAELARQGPTVLAAVHLCSAGSWDEVHRYLNTIERLDLHVSFCGSIGLDYRHRVLSAYPDARIEQRDVPGHDMGHFLESLRKVDLGAYDLVCKIAIDVRAGRRDGDADSGDMLARLDRLLGGPNIALRVRDLFRRDPFVGLMVPVDAIDTVEAASCTNLRVLATLADQLDLAIPERIARDASAYAMFWTKPLALTRLRNVTARALFSDVGRADEQVRSAMHIIIPLVVQSAGYEVRHMAPAATGARAGLAVGRRRIKIIALYLPQFHPIPENDAWWGQGYTEWAAVARARPLYEGHRQPRLPTDLGFYDLRVPETRQQQADLAAAYGVHAFCYYYYWFDGWRILERPLNELLASGQPDFPFCICWANENWTRRWDGLNHEVLLRQSYSPDSSRRFIRDLVPLLRDPRYLRYDGKPVLIVYRVRDIPNVAETLRIWRHECRAAGVGDIHIAGVRFWDIVDVQSLGFDAAVDFPPHHLAVRKVTREVRALAPTFSGQIYDYKHAVQRSLDSRGHGYGQLSHRAVMLAWDNTPRRGTAAHIAHGATPELYRQWLRGVIDQEMQFNPAPESLIFVNAWNEWGEGANLEPDSQFGRGFLEATHDALAASASAWDRQIRRSATR